MNRIIRVDWEAWAVTSKKCREALGTDAFLYRGPENSNAEFAAQMAEAISILHERHPFSSYLPGIAEWLERPRS